MQSHKFASERKREGKKIGEWIAIEKSDTATWWSTHQQRWWWLWNAIYHRVILEWLGHISGEHCLLDPMNMASANWGKHFWAHTASSATIFWLTKSAFIYKHPYTHSPSTKRIDWNNINALCMSGFFIAKKNQTARASFTDWIQKGAFRSRHKHTSKEFVDPSHPSIKSARRAVMPQNERTDILELMQSRQNWFRFWRLAKISKLTQFSGLLWTTANAVNGVQ